MEPPYGSPWARLGGYVIDGALAYVVQIFGGFLGGFVAAMIVSTTEPANLVKSAAEDGMMLGFVFWAFVWWFLNYGVLQGLNGATLGKLMTGLRVVNRKDGSPIGVAKSLGRTVLYLVSALPLYAGFLAVFWDKERRCWHDRLCGTVVIRKGAVYSGVAGGTPGLGEDRPVFQNAA